MKIKHFLSITKLMMLLCVISFTISSCGDDDDSTPEPQLSGAKDILTFTFADLDPDVVGTISGTNVTATVPYNVDVTALVPTITVSEKASVQPATGVAQDFTSPVTYTVTAEDGTEQVYTVTVTQDEPPMLAIETLWERNLNGGNLPSWFTANNDRDLAAFGDYVYVHNNNDKIRVISSATGEDVDAGNGTGFLDGKQNFASGNIFLINVDTDDNGVIVGSNLRQGNGTNPWNIYKWADKDADQELLSGTYVPAQGVALADNIAVVGDVNGDGYIYAPGDGFFGATNQVFRFPIADGVVGEPAAIALEGLEQIGNGNDVYPTSGEADASMIVAGTAVGGIAEYAADGSLVGRLPEALNEGETALLFTFALDVHPFMLSGRKIVAATATDFTENAATSGYLYLIDYTDGWENVTADNIKRVALTPEGNIDTNFNGTGGVDVIVDDANSTATVYAMLTNFGVGAYTVTVE